MTRVLVVDDDDSVRAVVQTVLEVERGWDVDLAEDGVVAMEWLDSDDNPTPDVVVLDVMMPGASGFEVLDWLRDHDWYFDLPVIMLTAKVQVEDQLAGWRSGCDGYVTKPFDNQDLLDAIDLVLDAGSELRALRRRDRLAELLAGAPPADGDSGGA